MWTPIKGWENLYAISKTGKVKSLGREVVYYRPDLKVWHTRYIPGRVLKYGVSRKGYQVYVFADGERLCTVYAHRLMMDTFVGPKPNGLETRHLNGNSQDNRIKNLRYGTTKENGADRARHNKRRKE